MNLIETKLEEYSDFPALVLGLDGWLLKSVPVDVRPIFLRAFQKSLQIAFHPDRVISPEAKISREKYLQVVGDAIHYLCDSQMNYELATDNVPTKRNPLVGLQNSIISRDALIEDKCAEISELKSALGGVKENLQAERLKLAQYEKAMITAQYSGYRVRNWLRLHTQDLVSLRLQRLQFSGQEIAFQDLAKALVSDGDFTADKPKKMRIVGGKFENERVIGALSKVHFQEYVKARNNWEDFGADRLNEILHTISENSLKNFILPFYTVGTAIITLREGGGFRVVVVNSIPKENSVMRLLNAELRRERANSAHAKTQVRKLKAKIKKLEKCKK